MAITWRQLIQGYEDGEITMKELEWAIFRTFLDVEVVRDFLANAPQKYVDMAQAKSQTAPATEEDWARLRIFGSNMTDEHAARLKAAYRAGINVYRSSV